MKKIIFLTLTLILIITIMNLNYICYAQPYSINEVGSGQTDKDAISNTINKWKQQNEEKKIAEQSIINPEEFKPNVTESEIFSKKSAGITKIQRAFEIVILFTSIITLSVTGMGESALQNKFDFLNKIPKMVKGVALAGSTATVLHLIYDLAIDVFN